MLLLRATLGVKEGAAMSRMARWLVFMALARIVVVATGFFLPLWDPGFSGSPFSSLRRLI
jgi:hypothetical protein